MDLIVLAYGTARNVAGITAETTCAQVVYALAHAINQKGRFVLVATFNDSDREYRLSPDERPFNLIEQCSCQGIDVGFELRKLSDLNLLTKTNLSNENAHYKTLSGSHQHSLGFSIDDMEKEEKRKEHKFNNQIYSIINQPNGNSINVQQENSSLSFLGSTDLNSQDFLHNISPLMLNNELKIRPPPPTYNQIIEQRCNSLSRNVSLNKWTANDLNRLQILPDFSSVLNLSEIDLSNQTLPAAKLDEIVDVQCTLIAAQKNELLSLELTLSNDAERELVQLKKQHNNLQTVLNSFRNADWLIRMKAEQCEEERLHTAIDAMKTAIENKRRELYQIVELQKALEHQYTLEETQCDEVQNNQIGKLKLDKSENVISNFTCYS